MADRATIQNIIAGLTPRQQAQLDKIHVQVKVELARNYGERLAPIITDVLVQESTTHPKVLASLEGIPDSLPTDVGEWSAFVRNLVENNGLAKRNIAFSNEKKREEMKADELARLRPDQRVSLSRVGRLEDVLDERVRSRLELEQ